MKNLKILILPLLFLIVPTSYADDQVDGRPKIRISDLPLFKDWSPKAEVPISDDLRNTLGNDLAKINPAFIQDALFIITPDGRLERIGKYSELESILSTLTISHAADNIPAAYRPPLIQQGVGHSGKKPNEVY